MTTGDGDFVQVVYNIHQMLLHDIYTYMCAHAQCVMTRTVEERVAWICATYSNTIASSRRKEGKGFH